MANMSQHAQKAEALLKAAEDAEHDVSRTFEEDLNLILRAQVHATMALFHATRRVASNTYKED